MKIFRKGFSLVELMIVIGALSGVSLLVMQLKKNMMDVETSAIANNDYMGLRKEIDFLVENANDCSASVRGTSFRGSLIKTNSVPVELWTADQKGQRSRKKFSGSDLSVKKSGKVIIDSISFTMPDYTAGTDFPAGKESFKGNISIKTSIQKSGKLKKMADIQKPMVVTFDTDIVGMSTLKFCGVLSFMSSGAVTESVPPSAPAAVSIPTPSPAATSNVAHVPAPVPIPTSTPTPTIASASAPVAIPIAGTTALSGTISGNVGEIKLPEGNLTVTLMAKYNYCTDIRAILYFNDVNVGEAVGDGNDIEGCAENVMMSSTSLTSNGGTYPVKLVPQNNKGPNSIQWFILPQ